MLAGTPAGFNANQADAAAEPVTHIRCRGLP